jgi:uncharacterized membrane protein YbhN (UPF0104 family)
MSVEAAPPPAVEPADVESRAFMQRALLLAALVAGGVAALVWLPWLQPVRDRFTGTDGTLVVVALALQILSTLSFVAAFRGAFERRIGWRAAFDLAMIEQGANVILPSGGSGGLAVGAILLVRAGVPRAFAVGRTAVLFLATSAASFLALFAAGIGEALGILPGHASLAATLGPAVGALLVMALAIVLPHRLPTIEARSDQRMRSALRGVQRYLREAIDLTIEKARGRDALLIGGSLGYLVFDVASLAVAFEALGGGALPVGIFVLAYVLGHAGAAVPLPGSAEGGLVGVFALYGTPLSLALGAVLVYRTFHAGVPLLLALAGYADVRRLRRHRPSPEELARRFA